MGNGVMQKAVGALGKTMDSLSQASSEAASALNAVGMTGTASAVNDVAQKAHVASESSLTIAVLVGDRYENLAESYLKLAHSLEDDFAPPLAQLEGVVAELTGILEENWRGTGAKAYRDHTDLQVKAASELSSHLLAVAKGIEDSLASEHTMYAAVLSAIATAIVGIVAAFVPLLVPVTTLVALGAIAAAAGFLITAICTSWQAYTTFQNEVQSSLHDLSATLSNGGSTVFPGHWPSRRLYGGGPK